MFSTVSFQKMVMMVVVMTTLMMTASSLSLTCSSCPAKHLQQQYCDSEIVLRGRVREDMTVKVVSLFKSPRSFSAIGRGGLSVAFERPSCRESHLKPGLIYLIMGSSHGNVLHIGSCDAVKPWSTLTSVQRQGVQDVYGLFCDACRVNETYSIIRPNTDPFLGGNEILSGADTLWRREDCFYNPLASRQYMVEDCETSHSVCMPNMDGTGRCSWLQSEKYEYCSKQRKNSPCLQVGGAYAFLAGWTCPENCLSIQEDCLREMCLQATAGVVCPKKIRERRILQSLLENL